MEASVTTGGAVEGQQAEGSAGAEQQQGQEQAQEPNYDPIFERLDQMRTDLSGELEQRMAALQPQQQEQTDPVADDLREVMESEDVDPAQARAVLDRMVEAKANELVSPLAQEIAELRAERAGEQLMEKYPELRDTAKAEAAYEKALDLASQIARGDQQLAEWLSNQPQIVEAAYLADIARQRAAEEASSQQQQEEVALESAGAAAPGGAENPDDQIIGAILGAGGGERNTFLTG